MEKFEVVNRQTDDNGVPVTAKVKVPDELKRYVKDGDEEFKVDIEV